MGNCLKTQLKQVVNNDNLDYLGGIKGYCYIDEATQFGTNGYSSNIGVTVEEGHNVIAKNYSGQTVPLPISNLSADIYLKTDSKAKVFISQYYDLRMLRNLGNLKIENLKYMTKLTTFGANGQHPFIGCIDCKDLPASLVSFQVFQNSGVSGLVEDIKAYNITKLWTSSRDISGEVKTLVERFFGQRTDFTNSLNLQVAKGSVKFNGTVHQYYKLSFSASEVVVESSNVELGSYNGSTWTYA